ncbi:long-chain-fatty-acid--CoA ligase [Saccharopolyspora flava]|uniref:Acyl-CoA synthetase (AMP-forming)/AMP-acid ligase II n=1 Tax=Saccharopolyspora flava TaxID=95161 RepID=A0A1I6TMV9_9PSEU|nr:long-chain-fatty-acid--CoA ligase [Saccharopolyspora flava]SFS90494.1 Acyl-CoA synthetase (AMP-forming)/AMP-acid ligase II [Saccharopolyspora flava]
MSAVPVYGAIEHWVEVAPDREALVFGERSWSWAELDRRVRRVAGALRAAGVEPGDRFAVLDKKHPVCLELTLAASLIGAANAVVNFRLSAEELAHVLGDSTARLAVVGEEFAPALRELQSELPRLGEVIVLGGESDQYEEWIAAAEPVADPHPAEPGDCFLQLYTSGTTGWPKGAMLTQRSMSAHTGEAVSAYDMDERTINVVAMPLYHVGGTSWALASMSAGARTIIVRDIVPAALLDLVERSAATHAFFVPAVIQMLLSDPERARTALRSLEVLGYGGSPMPAPLMERLLSTLDTPLHSVYGMTEMSGVFCVLGPAEHRDDTREHLRASAGRPLPGTELRVVDPATGDDVAPGEVGEFWVRSEQMMAGYWHMPEATRDTITPDGWLRTGDAGRQDGDGYLYIEDRVKDMVISGGENIYPAEVERVVIEHPAVADAAVIGVPHETWGETVKAVVVPTDGAEIDEAEIIAFARERLAHYKCPTSVTVVAELPRNPTGKILKRQLRTRYVS